ncbi:RNA-binding protein 34 [Amyelois transitella]|uniref:RNA-binding protein 34 n=1 Tax=Amyelois transitella TaxID=680683 RepID=UPI002990833B|nr:RNA-binding protein 34 [Amyelois transitella]
MDYVVGSVAALISGNVTPNRPKLVRRALTPTKHQPSPNVTPKSQFAEDRSLFLSPTQQKKKAIVKKSPKRIFQNPDLDVTLENEGKNSQSSPKANKVKKHLKEDLEADNSKGSVTSSPKNRNKSLDTSTDISSSKKKPNQPSDNVGDMQNNEMSKKKKNKKHIEEEAESQTENKEENIVKSPKRSKKRTSAQIEQNAEITESSDVSPKKKSKKVKHSESNENNEVSENTDVAEKIFKKNKKKHNKTQKKPETNDRLDSNCEEKEESQKKPLVNPNAVTDKDTDSEHESDNEIESENDEANKDILDTGPAQDSSDEEEEASTSKNVMLEKAEKTKEPVSDDEVRRTLFVGNVPYTKKCKKELKKIFSKYGTIETVRIRTVPVKDPRYTPKLALIKNELHPERTTVNVYVKFKEESSVEQALSENNTVLNDHHLRVTRSQSTGAAHDPKCSVFVGNLPFGLEDEAFRAKFESCGQIESVRIIRDKKTNAGKGFGYINFASKDGVELALNLTEEDLTIKNRILRVKRCMQSRPGTNPGPKGNQSLNHGGNRGFVRRNDGQGAKHGNSHGKFPGKFQGNKEEGAYRRIMNKRKGQEGGEAPFEKKAKNSNQPQKEKKQRKEFVGMTAEKRKKHTFNKGQKKKKILSEILANK